MRMFYMYTMTCVRKHLRVSALFQRLSNPSLVIKSIVKCCGILYQVMGNLSSRVKVFEPLNSLRVASK